MSKKLFIVGTGTDVGKTYITGLIIKKLVQNKKNAAYYKAAMSGNICLQKGNPIPQDGLEVKNISDISQPISEMCPYVYEMAVSPHLAARIEGKPVDLNVVKRHFEELSLKYDYITVEGSGGIVCPLRFGDKEIYLEDIIKLLDAKCIIIADAGLGTINYVTLTAKYMELAGIKVKGIIFNNFDKDNIMHIDNVEMCRHLTGLEVLCCVKKNEKDLDIPFERLELLYE